MTQIRFHLHASKKIVIPYPDGHEGEETVRYTERDTFDFGHIVRTTRMYEDNGYEVRVVASIIGHQRTVYANNLRQMSQHDMAVLKPCEWVRSCDFTGFDLAALCRQWQVEMPANVKAEEDVFRLKISSTPPG